MKKLSILLVLLIVTNISFGQDTSNTKPTSFFDDTTLIRTALMNTFKVGDRIISFNLGKHAILYLNESDIVNAASMRLRSNFNLERANCELILGLLRQNKKSDTVFVKNFPQYFNSLVSEQLRKGNVRIIDKKTHLFAPFIYQRLERVISTAYRVYYFDDNRRFFQVQEWSGIIPNELTPEIE